MKLPSKLQQLAALTLIAALTACGGTSGSGTDDGGTDNGSGSGGGSTTTDGTDGTVVQTFSATLNESEVTQSDPLPKGTYVVKVTRTSGAGEGVAVEWSDSSCPSSTQTKSYHNLCTLSSPGTLKITNPQDPWYKGNESVSVEIRKVSATQLAAGFVVASENQSVYEGSSRTYELVPGRYKAEISGASNGVNIAWSGASCTGLTNGIPSNAYTCNLSSGGGSLTITNPEIPWFQGDENLSIKVSVIN